MTEDPTTVVDPQKPSISGTTAPGSDEENQTAGWKSEKTSGPYYASRQTSLGTDPRRSMQPLVNGYASMRRTLTQPQATPPQAAMYRKEFLVPPVVDDTPVRLTFKVTDATVTIPFDPREYFTNFFQIDASVSWQLFSVELRPVSLTKIALP